MTRKWNLWLAFLLAAWSVIALLATEIRAYDDDDDYVRQVVEEDQQHYNDNYAEEDDAYEQRQQQFMDAEERAAQEAADKIASERERKFQAELDRIDDEEKRKQAIKQKKRDGRRVRSILKASKNNNLYKVLGIREWNIKTPSFQIGLPGGPSLFTIPGFSILGEATESQIKKKFRQRAMQVHPDKNRDGRAQEAFVAVQNAAGILSDERLRSEYDEERNRNRSERMASQKRIVSTVVSKALGFVRRIVGVLKSTLGPLFIPVSILLAIII